MPMHPVVLFMEVDDDDSFSSEYRVQIGNCVNYLIISPNTFDKDRLSFSVQSLPALPWNGDWTMAHISRDDISGELRTSISTRPLAGVRYQRHDIMADCLDLMNSKMLTAMAFEAVRYSITPSSDRLPVTTVIAKIARFEWEIPRIERESRAYQLLDGSGLAPPFLGHIRENGRIIGFLLKKVKGCHATIQDLKICEAAPGNFRKLGLLHGDVNRYNFLVTQEGVKLLDFECFQVNASSQSMHRELGSIRMKLMEISGRGGGFVTQDDSN
ncbi:hypothetical protein BO82DRAFT_286313 [Aspergillus uvarum CBS 121591]|uniref:Alpha-galactosidase A n=1 Tax=Aspergillus uvarum CBS 121591 TaxID=1448315 RepID=A0A319C9M0_9EURO|nr:hypothetical protein BO82DRAFT_286313 [Aspergillus uvarum CBS 121591]PYH80571.1 hypothetical protein BO82DRAFT_286313 [Aspergillus uvarum CBS 121591]